MTTQPGKAELWIKLFTPVITIAGILIGIWQFNEGQKTLQEKALAQREHELQKLMIGNQFEALARFKEIQAEKYKEATEIISKIIYTDSYQSQEFNDSLERFWQLYYVELSAVEDLQVEQAMVQLGNHIRELQKQNFIDLSEAQKTDLFQRGLQVAQAIKESSKHWELPQELQEIQKGG